MSDLWFHEEVNLGPSLSSGMVECTIELLDGLGRAAVTCLPCFPACGVEQVLKEVQLTFYLGAMLDLQIFDQIFGQPGRARVEAKICKDTPDVLPGELRDSRYFTRT
ncbi:MAG TPA: hypothetical protein VEV39_00380 [Gemmatimonadales bacterium]|nr:hypothetical protein [Gemmatimonadales bacterium]